MRQSLRISCTAGLFVCVNLLCASPQAQKHEPLTEGEIIQLLQGGVAPERVGRLAREYGITFDVTPAVERDLRASGAKDPLLQTLRELAAGRGAKAKKELPKTEAPQATTGTLLITADARCNLSVDGESAGDLAPGTPKRVSVPFGEHLLHAESKEEASASVDWTGKVATPEQQLVQLSLADKIAKVIAARKTEEAERAAEVVLWKSIENSARIEDFRAYLQKYPNGTFATVASARIEKLEADAEADAKTKKAEDERKRQEDEKQAEIRKYTFPVAHVHHAGACWGHLQITSDGATYQGNEDNVSFSKNDVIYIDISGYSGFLRFHLQDKNWSFAPVDEADVRNQKFKGAYPPSMLGNGVVEKWGFVPANNGKRLVPPNR